jgi:hypothetical protein
MRMANLQSGAGHAYGSVAGVFPLIPLRNGLSGPELQWQFRGKKPVLQGANWKRLGQVYAAATLLTLLMAVEQAPNTGCVPLAPT